MQNQAQFFVGWGTLSLINAGLAQAKGRSGFLWWIVSLFLGPIARFADPQARMFPVAVTFLVNEKMA